MEQGGNSFRMGQRQAKPAILRSASPSSSTWVVLNLLLVCSVLLLAGCLPPTESSLSSAYRDFSRDPMQQARVNCFLVLKDPNAPGMRMELSSLEILAGDIWLPLIANSMAIDSVKLGEGQLLLGGQNLPPGEYRRLRMKVSEAKAQNSQGDYVEISAEPVQAEYSLTLPLTLNLDDSDTLLLTWDVEASRDINGGFRPEIVAAPPNKEMLRDLILVSCPNIDTVFVVRADNNWVVNSFGLKGGPTYLAFDPSSSDQRLYVLAARDRMVKVVDLNTYRMVEFFAVPLNDDPTFMTISPDGRDLYLLDEKSGYLNRLDTDSGSNLARTLLEYRPSYVLYLPEQELLAASLSLSQQVVLLDPLTLNGTGSISTGNSPQGMLVDGTQLYIAESGDNSVAVADLRGRGKQSRLPVGFKPHRLVMADSQIYVSNRLDGTLSVLGEGELGVIQEIFGLGLPGEMALNQFYRRLYIADEENGALTVVDVNANRTIKHIELGAKPFGMVGIQ